MEGTARTLIPTTKNCASDLPDLGKRRGQPAGVQWQKPRSGVTAFVITVYSMPSKFNERRMAHLHYTRYQKDFENYYLHIKI